MTLNESKLTAMVEAVKNEFDGFFEDIILSDLRIERLRTALTPFCMELTDDELFIIASQIGGSDTWIEGAKFVRDYGK